MKKIRLTAIFTLMVSLLLAACQPAAPIKPPVVEKPPAGEEYVYGQDAVVESLEVLLLESFPLQAQAVVSGYLPDGCTELVEIEVERRGNEFRLTLNTRRPSGNVACTLALVPFEERVPLDIQGLEAGTYTVIAQDQRAQFILDVDNVISEDPIIGGEHEIPTSSAVVESLSVLIMESDPVQVQAVISGYLPDGCTKIREVITSRAGDTFNIRILTQHPGGDVACTMAIVPFEERVDLEVEGLPAGEYTVRVGELSETFRLDTDN